MTACFSKDIQYRKPGAKFKFAACAFACLALLAACAMTVNAAPQTPAATQPVTAFTVSFGPELSATPLDGRVYVVISANNSREPRLQIVEEEVESQQIFGAD